MGEYLKSESDF